MCGISGFVDFNKKLTRQQLLLSVNTLQHRGPDDCGDTFLETTEAFVGLSHRRLAILDLSPMAHQPMQSADGSVTILLNGEVYNFKEIRDELQAKGYHFLSGSDTEVILQAYQHFGMECISHFIGMFSIVIYDASIQKVFLIRDRPGVKPLYYYFADGYFLFASELKAFHPFPCFKKEIDAVSASLYFKYGYIKAPNSIFKNARKLQPGYFATIDLASKSLQLKQYWNVLDYYNKPAFSIDKKQALQELETLCVSAFQYRMISDVPVGIFLSGGYDSSLLAAILQNNSANKIKTFTIGFNEKQFNEANHAKKIAQYLGTDHNEHFCTAASASEVIPALPFYYDEPFGDSSAIPTVLLSRFAKQQVTVALSADGADELFAGYNRYTQLSTINKVQKIVPVSIRRTIAKMIGSVPAINTKYKKIALLLSECDSTISGDLLNAVFLETDLQNLLQPDFAYDVISEKKHTREKSGFINSLLAADFTSYLPDDILAKVDRAAMSTGLEAREPFLDHRLVEWAAQLPVDMKYNNGHKKYLLTELTHQYLPGELMKRPKMGFGIPLRSWLKGSLKALVMQTIIEENLSKQNVLDKNYVLQLKEDYYSGKINDDQQIWLILMFLLWWNEWM
ncbi:MAG: asparagine synthase [Ferruginibacter sp.]|uniref:asparagine synthase (glutamine-hydrolyzing) n=1 Tax=Ferruginibacter sp. TaxID=1940288 RepID=UPI00265AA3B0|nr:asparagine synthase (glutamine-hydrolyzing) [Ferruginibacter sp.]MDB5280529.1 asparagine synthase [Ferruginibacter sp.]